MPTDRQIIAFVDTAENFHPWECDGQGRCRHCDRKKDDTHDPDTCAFCMDDAGLLEGDPMTDELGGGAPTREDGEPVATSAALPPPAQPPSPEPLCPKCGETVSEDSVDAVKIIEQAIEAYAKSLEIAKKANT